jgi:outer membrane protein OmpA-like peptidoglycan-associated protein
MAMSTTTKILVGALVTTALAWFLHAPMKFGENCAAAAKPVIASAPPVTASAPPAPEAPATAEAVANCQTNVNETISGKTINFASGGSSIAVDSQPLIDAIAKSLTDCAGTTIEVAGHTDITGGDAANQRLSEERANSVVQALAAKGVPAERLVPKGYGETKPLDPATTPAAFAKNRRIDFTVAATSAMSPAATGAQ